MSPTSAPGVRAGIGKGLALGPPVFAFGASFGVLAGPAGMGLPGALVMSATTFGGSAQFAAASVLTAQGTAVAASVSAILLNVRYLPISISLARALSGPWWRRTAEAQVITDESWVLSRDAAGHYDRGLLVGSGVALWVVWMLGTLAGALGARYIGDPKRFGLDVAFPALFVALLPEQLTQSRAAVAAALGAAISLAVAPVTSTGVAIIASVLACSAGLVGPAASGARGGPEAIEEQA